MGSTTIALLRPGITDYHDAWAWQREAADALRSGTAGEAIALLQHRPVYTLGRRAKSEHLLAGASELRRRGAAVVEVDRGGDVTFHGPGQLVAYPILDLRARHLLPGDYVRLLESVVIDVLAGFGVTGERLPGRPGVWAGGGKIAAVGVRVQGGVTTHGFAFNVSCDLSWFDAVIPCGLAGATVTSMATISADAPSVEDVADAVAATFAHRLDAELLPADDGRVSVPPSRAAGTRALAGAGGNEPHRW